MFRKNIRVLTGQAVGVIVLWSLLARQVRMGAHDSLTGYFLLLLFVAAVGAPVTIGVHAFVGEKDRRTIEPLLLLPVPMATLVRGKLLSTVGLALAELVVVYLLGVGAVLIFGHPDQYRWVINPVTGFIAGVLGPLFTILFALMALTVSGRTADTQTAFGITTLLAAPIALFLVGLIVGALTLSGWAAVWGSGVILLAVFVMYRVAVRSLTAERLLERRGVRA
jgi:ABC-type Na+ efflux pump permease subunit